MHPNPIYRSASDAQNIAFARGRGFGVLITAGDTPLLSHVPFVLSEDGTRAELHLVRSNPIARMDLPCKAVIAVTGPDGYISPDWYGANDQVPTWNYVAVHLRGLLRPIPQDDLRGVLDRLSAHNEEQLWDKAPWTSDKMTPDVRDRMMRQIRPFQFDVETVDGTWKLNQNKPDAVRLGAAKAVTDGIGSDLAHLSDLMRNPPKT